MPEEIIAKNYSNTYLYTKGEYEKKIFDFIMKSEQINKLDSSFEDIRYEVKRRQVTSVLVKVLDSKNVIILRNDLALPRSFKVFAAKDIKGDHKMKIFIDASEIIQMIDGRYECTKNNIDILISYLLSAMNQLIYYTDPKRILMNNTIISEGTECFADLFTYIMDYLKISGLTSIKEKCLYLASLYFQICIMGKNGDDEGARNRALKISGISDREAQIVDMQIDDNAMLNIKFFMETLSKILKLDKLTLEAFLDKWVYLYGTGTQFAMELYPAFASMITNAYVGAYLNNQKTIEKVTGKNMVDFTRALFTLGSEAYA